MSDIFDEVEPDTHQIAAEIIKQPAENWLTDQYLPFAAYAIRSRALVADDGLKPVNRRIVYSLYKEGITPNSDHLKAARAAANAVAYHPHGTSSIEDALSRMAQNFSLRVPLIDPYGSVGKVTGDIPAAARYWECRLSRPAMELVKELPEGAVPIGKNFDGKLDEPKLLPVRWPNNIINGTQGIAVGYASNMFSHNPDEVMKAAIAILKNPNLTIDQLLKIMPGPDLPTGGELFEINGVKDYYTTGSGRFTIRGRYTVEKLPRGKVRIIFYELPYQIAASQVIEKIRELQGKGRFKDVSLAQDFTDKKRGLRVAIETKAGSNYLTVLNELFKYTPVETPFSVNNTVLLDGRPVQVGMLVLLQRFVDFRRDCTLNKAKAKLEKIDARIHQLNAILAALIDIDKCIAIIRKADTATDARSQLMKAFKLDEEQADYILSMQLRRLTRADAIEIKRENDGLLEVRKDMEEIISSQARLDLEVETDIKDTLKVITSKRLTIISGMTSEELKEASKEIAQEARDVDKDLPCYITRFADGRIIKTNEPFTYTKTLRKWAHSPIIEQIKVRTQDSIVLVGSDGMGHTIPLSYVSLDHISKPADVGVHFNKGVNLVAIAKSNPLKTDIGLMLATRNGDVKIVRPDLPQKESFVVYTLPAGDAIITGKWLGKALTNSAFVSISSGGNILIYDATTVRTTGFAAGGVKSQRLRDGENVVFFGWVPSLKTVETMVISQSQGTLKVTPLSDVPPKGKGSQGVALHKFKRDETSLTHAYVGENLILGMVGLNNAIQLPTASRRAVVGVDFTIDSVMGVSSVTTM